MAENDGKLLLLGSSPHIASPVTTAPLMRNVLIAIAPTAIFGVYLYGVPALLNILVSMAAACLGETLFRLAIKQPPRFKDLSCLVTGLLLALVLPPSTPLWMTALGAIFAVVVAKEFFGGLGANVFNPALIGRAFLLMSFPSAITSWTAPRGVALDVVSGATPLGYIKQGMGRVADYAAAFGGGDYATVLKNLFFGTRAGSIGESSIVLILAGAAFLLITQTIDWRAPAAMIGTACLASLVLGLDPLFGILSGGLVFGAFFMATDYVSAPVTASGKLIFGAGAGLLTVLIRKWGNYPEGVSYGILIMNIASPFLNRLIQKKYGFVPPKKGAAK
jgi:electron transport complex protein RnfD